MRRLLLLALLVFMACGEPVTEGYIRQRKFEPAHWEGGYETHTRVVHQCRTVSRYDSLEDEYVTEQECGPETETYQEWESHHHMVDDAWSFKLEECKFNEKKERKCRTGWVSVDETTFHGFENGEHYLDLR